MPDWIRDQLVNLAAYLGSVIEDPAADEAFALRHAHEDLTRILADDESDSR
ncbi:hypothetical protein [Nonomuraea diastatica]|uniref:hypothetical protein n=1 Tax=Nonomuraea diastatica TaxID=1848329 RepID=UPI00140C8BDC|nr:hypothetical protein [Nonomuraea diastatica]